MTLKKAAAVVLAIGLIGGLGVGCAVMRVDVDVYKGALTNDEDVQLQQLAAMAIGARPLLEDMRDSLQHKWSFDPKWHLMPTDWGRASDYRKKLLKNKDISGYLVPDPVRDHRLFDTDLTRRLNEILTLYENTAPPKLAELKDQYDRLGGTALDKDGTALQADLPKIQASAKSILSSAKVEYPAHWESMQEAQKAVDALDGIHAGSRDDDIKQKIVVAGAAFDRLPFSFARGRTPIGLSQLVEGFTAAQTEKCRIPADAEAIKNYDAKQAELLQGLVQFAEKVRALADQGIFTDESDIKLFPDKIVGLAGYTTDRYRGQVDAPALLQSLANSILVQANEYQHARTAKEELVRALPREADARNKALGLVPHAGSTTKKGEPETEGPKPPIDLSDCPKDPCADAVAGQDCAECKNQNRGIASSADLMDQFITYLQYRQVEEMTKRENWESKYSEKRSYTESTQTTGGTPAPAPKPKASGFIDAYLSGESRVKFEGWLRVAGLPIFATKIPAAAAPPPDTSRSTTTTSQMDVDLGNGLAVNPKADAIQKALEKLLEYRASKVAIRPSLAALKSSYAASTLQNDPTSVGWKNMLAASANRGLPLIGEKVFNDGWNPLEWKERGRRRHMAMEIDKQYWQSINSVRVSGAGKTNYVVAKDDIGNWYVKQYSSDPESIIKAARNLALFSLSSAGTGNLLANLKDSPGLTKGIAGNAAGGAPQTKLEALYEKKQGEYAAATAGDLEAAEAALITDKKLSTDVVNAWGTNTKLATLVKDAKGLSDKAHVTAFDEKGLLQKLDPKKSDPKTDPVVADSKRFAGLVGAAMNYAAATAKDLGTEALATEKKAVADAKAPIAGLESDLAALKATYDKAVKDAYNAGLEVAAKELVVAPLNLKVEELAKQVDAAGAGTAERIELEKQLKVAQDNAKPEQEALTRLKTAKDEADKAVETAKTNMDAGAKKLDEQRTFVATAETALKAKQALLAEAVAILNATVRAQLKPLLDRREKTIGEYETAVDLIAEGAG